MENQFIELGVSEVIAKSLDEMGFTAPTEVQSKVIPKVLNKEDLIVMSKTGSGKTAAFGIPLIQMIERGDGAPQALILTPTRELAVQVEADLKKIAKHKQVRIAVVYGQHSMANEVQTFEKGVDIVVGTPGRVYDHIEQGKLKTHKISYLVLDEADRMLDMGFIDQVTRIIKRIPAQRGTLLFSATMPTEINKLCRNYMSSPGMVEIASETKTVDTIHQIYYRVEHSDKRRQLQRILTVEQPESCIIFCNTRMAVDMVNDYLNRKGYTCKAIHGANTQSNRMHSMGQFKKGAFQILVATDVAARGIHIDDLSLVINYDVPNEKDSYVHRIGRTGRAGNGGKAITLVTSGEVYALYEIEEHVGVMISEEELPSDAAVAEKQKTHVNPRPNAQTHKPSAPRSNTHKPSAPRSNAHKPSGHKTNAHKTVHHNKAESTSMDKTDTKTKIEPVIVPVVPSQVTSVPSQVTVAPAAPKGLLHRIASIFKKK